MKTKLMRMAILCETQDYKKIIIRLNNFWGIKTHPCCHLTTKSNASESPKGFS